MRGAAHVELHSSLLGERECNGWDWVEGSTHATHMPPPLPYSVTVIIKSQCWWWRGDFLGVDAVGSCFQFLWGKKRGGHPSLITSPSLLQLHTPQGTYPSINPRASICEEWTTASKECTLEQTQTDGVMGSSGGMLDGYDDWSAHHCHSYLTSGSTYGDPIYVNSRRSWGSRKMR